MTKLSFSFETGSFHLSFSVPTPASLKGPEQRDASGGIWLYNASWGALNSPDLPVLSSQVVPDVACGNASSNNSAGGRLVSFEVPQNASVK